MMNLMNYANDMGHKEEHFCVSWLPDGKAFVIYDVKDFTNSVIPKFFKASKFCSFTRKRTFYLLIQSIHFLYYFLANELCLNLVRGFV